MTLAQGRWLLAADAGLWARRDSASCPLNPNPFSPGGEGAFDQYPSALPSLRISVAAIQAPVSKSRMMA